MTKSPTEQKPADPVRDSATEHHLRRSRLLLGGRVISLVINFVVGVLLVRALDRVVYGDFGFALSVVAVATNVCLLGGSRSLNVLLPQWDEQRDGATAVGTTLLILSAAAGASGLVALGLGLQGSTWPTLMGISPEAARLLGLLALLVPIQTIDALAQSIAASLVGARLIFFRRQVLGPCLRLVVVVAAVCSSSGVSFVAIGYVGAALLGLLAYGPVLTKAFAKRGWLGRDVLAAVRVDLRTVVKLGPPFLWMSVSQILVGQLAVLLLHRIQGPADVAALRAVLPIAALVFTLTQSYKLMFVQAQCRLIVSGQLDEASELFWRTATAIAVVGFPMFTVIFLFSEPLTVLLFGERYRDGAALLSILVVGQFLSSILGLSTSVLQAHRRSRALALQHSLGLLIALALHIGLIRAEGAIGAAWAASGSVVIMNLMAVLAVAADSPIRRPVGSDRRLLLIFGALAAGLMTGRWLLGPDPPLVSSAILAALVLGLAMSTAWSAGAIKHLLPRRRSSGPKGSAR